MRIGCLQFAPQVGDVDNNLNRADAVLNRSPDVDDLDLLVLPELAFTGYNFRSLSEIAPYLEPTGSGISALWARTIALKHNCNVIVGYPEKVDVTHKWPTSPEYYNSAIMINPNGETVANYRKSFLYSTDETWALEGDGFFEDELPGLGNVAMGICMDLNPYKFEAPFHAFEFAFHILEVEANLVILTMAWSTREEQGKFTQLPLEPDMDTLEYWLARLEPVIRGNTEEEIIVVFCNRTGVEGNVVYAGTSAVVGIKNGEVKLYGLLGRGTKELLVVDTEKLPIAKVVRELISEDVPADTDGAPVSQPAATPQRHVPFYAASRPTNSLPQLNTNFPDEKATGTPVDGKKTRVATPTVRNDLGTWDFMIGQKFDTDLASTTSYSNAGSGNRTLPKLGLEIPTDPYGNAKEHRQEQGGDIPTPTAPSPTPMSMRPIITFLQSGAANETLLPSFASTRNGDGMAESTWAGFPLTPPSKPSPNGNSQLQASSSDALPSPPTDDRLGIAGSKKISTQRSAPAGSNSDKLAIAEQALKTAKEKVAANQPSHEASSHSSKLRGLDLIDTGPSALELGATSPLDKPCEMKERKGALFPDMSYLDTLSAVSVDTRRELELAFAAIETPPTAMVPERPPSTKSRNASLSRPQSASGLHVHRRSLSQSHMSIPLIASPSIFRTGDEATRRSQRSVLYFRPDSSMATGTPNARTPSQSGKSHSMTRVDTTQKELPPIPGLFSRHRLSRSTSLAGLADADNERPMSRGRQPFTKTNPTNGAPGASRQSQAIPRVAGATATSRQPSGSRQNATSESRLNGNGGRTTVPSTGPASRTRAQSSTSSGWMIGPPPASMPQNPVEPGDEFIAIISRIDDDCPVHSGAVTASTQATTHPHQQHERTQSRQDSQGTQQQQNATTTTERAQRERAQRTGTAQSQSNQAAATPNQPASAPDQLLYEVILAPHIRDIVDSFTTRDRVMPSSRMSSSNRRHQTPIFDPPTPTAMEFTPSGAVDPAASSAVKVD